MDPWSGFHALLQKTGKAWSFSIMRFIHDAAAAMNSSSWGKIFLVYLTAKVLGRAIPIYTERFNAASRTCQPREISSKILSNRLMTLGRQSPLCDPICTLHLRSLGSGRRATVRVSTRYRCHHLCHLQMSLGSGGERVRSPLGSAAPDRVPTSATARLFSSKASAVGPLARLIRSHR